MVQLLKRTLLCKRDALAWHRDWICYLSVPLDYRIWQKKESKLELTTSMVRQVIPEFDEKNNVIILYDSWYVKKDLVTIVDEYKNLDLIGKAEADSVIYDLAPPRPAERAYQQLHFFSTVWTCYLRPIS